MMMRPLIRKNSRVKLDLELESRVFECIQKAPRQNLKNPKALNETVVHTVIVFVSAVLSPVFAKIVR
jgi:hypothetical protein